MDLRPLTAATAPEETKAPPSSDVPRHARVDRLLRTGHLLTASSVASSGLGAGYWVFVARWYSPADVGRGYATVSAMMFLAGFGQLNLANTLVRFVPSAGARTLRLVRRVYLVAACTTAVLATSFVIAVPHFSPQLSFLHSPGAGAGFVLAAAGYAVFVIQDGALTGLLRADWVLYENALFALAKILFVIGLSLVAAAQGILVSWYASLLLALLMTNWFLFSRAIPGRRVLPEPQGADAGRPTARYLAADFVGSMCWLVATTLMPVFVLDRLGAEQSAYFSLAWMVAYTFYLLSTNMGSSLIVEAAKDTAGLAANCRRILRHAGLLLGIGVAAGVVAAPWILRVFGAGYAASATGLLRLLLLSALPNLVVTAAVAVGRARRRVGAVVAVLTTLCFSALGLSALLLPRVGIAGAGYAWLISQSVVAAVLLMRGSWWLGTPPDRPDHTDHTDHTDQATRIDGDDRADSRSGFGADLVHAAMRRAARAGVWPSDRIAAYRLARLHGGAPGPLWRACRAALRAVRTPSDLLLIRVRRAHDGNQDHAHPQDDAQARDQRHAQNHDHGHSGDRDQNRAQARDQARDQELAVKCARTELARQTLSRQHSVLTRLHTDERLGAWRALLPRIVACDLDATPAWKVEGWLPGVCGSSLLRERPAAAARLTRAALAAIDDLHRATANPERVGEAHLNRWVDEPVRTLERHLRQQRPGTHAEAFEALRNRLHRQLHGRELAIGWVHRDFHPGNVLYARDGRTVTGIVDWGGAVPDGPTALDARLFDLAVRRETHGRCFGDLVIEALREGEDGLLLLAWLWHVTDNLDKSPRYMASRLWTGRNVSDVLKAVVAR